MWKVNVSHAVSPAHARDREKLRPSLPNDLNQQGRRAGLQSDPKQGWTHGDQRHPETAAETCLPRDGPPSPLSRSSVTSLGSSSGCRRGGQGSGHTHALVHTHTLMHTHTNTCTHTLMHTCMHKYTLVHTHRHTYMCTHAQTCAHTPTLMHVGMHRHAHTWVCMLIHAHTQAQA